MKTIIRPTIVLNYGTLAAFLWAYHQNEDINAHTDNVALLSRHFGTEDDDRIVASYQARCDQLGYAPPDASVSEIQTRCWREFLKTSKVVGFVHRYGWPVD